MKNIKTFEDFVNESKVTNEADQSTKDAISKLATDIWDELDVVYGIRKCASTLSKGTLSKVVEELLPNVILHSGLDANDKKLYRSSTSEVLKEIVKSAKNNF
jgi:hypothetical protein